MREPKNNQIWVEKSTGDRVKIIKILSGGYIKLNCIEGSKRGKQWQVQRSELITKYKFYRDA